jgi:hypothetical protein
MSSKSWSVLSLQPLSEPKSVASTWNPALSVWPQKPGLKSVMVPSTRDSAKPSRPRKPPELWSFCFQSKSRNSKSLTGSPFSASGER